ncbi:MAG: hypothetical protein K8T91_20915 [Planctomycetes bacterium]|nr:hypothetical protein [Planctomycetota bacterium]
MRQIIEDICRYLSSPKPVPETLIAAHRELEDLELRFICLELASWWGRTTLLQSRHPYLTVPPVATWSKNLQTAVSVTPELCAIVRSEGDRYWFAEQLTREEIQEINAYVQEHYRPRLMT